MELTFLHPSLILLYLPMCFYVQVFFLFALRRIKVLENCQQHLLSVLKKRMIHFFTIQMWPHLTDYNQISHSFQNLKRLVFLPDHILELKHPLH